MGKEQKFNRYRNRNHKPYQKKDDWKTRNQSKNNHPRQGNGSGKAKFFEPKITLREDQVGITEYTSECAGFTGIVKSRFSDFHVNEIDTNGKILHLTDSSVPQEKEDTLDEEEFIAAKKNLSDIITDEIWQQIEEMAALKDSDRENMLKIEIDVTDFDKEKRTQIHKVVKKLYNKRLASTTVGQDKTENNENEKKVIRIMKPKGAPGQNRNRWNFPGDYVHFLVHKENMDTSEVAITLADRLRLRPSQVNYCGTKDKRAKTTQKFCIKRRPPSQILRAIQSQRNVHIGNFEFSNEVLKLGDLKGNRFRIALRHVTGDRTKIETALTALRDRGFINYFGLQRFGNCASIPTYEVGIALLKSDYKLACELILKPRDNDFNFMREIREVWWKNRNSAAAADMFHNKKFIEKHLLDGLAQYGENDYAAALRKIPRNMLLLYPHAYQSLIFNRIASRRLKEYGLILIPGDLVYRNRDEQDVNLEEFENEMPDNETPTQETETDTEAEASETKKIINEEKIESKENETNEISNTEEESSFKRKVKPLTESDIASGNYTLFDVVLPLPGYDITYPDNAIGNWYRELLAADGLSSEKLRHNVKTFAMAGAYRKLLIQPSAMSWEFREYLTPECTLIASDWEQLKSIPIAKLPPADAIPKFTSLIMDFCLPTATYATMLLRELLKSDTSAMHQIKLELNEMKKSTIIGGVEGEAKPCIQPEEKNQKRKSNTETIVDEPDCKKPTLIE